MIRKIKNRIRDAAIGILTVLTVLTNMQLPIYAADHTATKTFIDGISYQVTKGSQSAWGQGFTLKMDGDVVFCIDPQAEVIAGGGYAESEFNASLRHELSVIAYEGYYKNRNKSDVTYYKFATNLMIWEKMGWSVTASGFDYSGYKSKIQKAVDSHSEKPSFDLDSITLNVGESITLTDTKGVFEEFHFVSSDGLKVKKDGNKLTITATEDAKDVSTITYNKVPDECVGTSLVYQKAGSQDMVKFFVKDPLRTQIRVNVNKYGSLKITKQDEDGAVVPNTSFKVSKNADMSSPIGTYKTGGDGTVTVNNLLPQKYYVQETAVPSHLVLDTTIREVTVEANQTTTYTARNNWVKGKVQLRKIDPKSGKQVAGATYAIYNDKGQELERLVTTATGYVESGYLRFGNYTVREVIAPSGYILNKTSYPVTIATNEQKITVTGEDERQTGRLELTKEDSVTGSAAQGEATLKGAVYELKAKENILDPADQSVKYAKGALVATLTTDANAKASVSNLYLGKYTLKEKTPSTGYTLDPITYDISIDYAGQSVQVVTKKQTVKERVKAQAFQIIKMSDNGAGEADKLAGVEFTVKAQKDIEKYGSWEKAPIAQNAKGQTAAILVTDKNGYAVSEELPYGMYVVRETKVPDDHYAVPDFTVTITEDSRDPQPWRIFNDEKFRAIIKMVKEDAETGKTVALAGTTFKIKNLKTNEYVGYWEWNPTPEYITEWTTDESGTVMTGKELDPGEYQIEELTAPNGYVLNIAPVKFKVTSNTAYETLPDGETPVITVVKQDTSVKGKVNVQKLGEVLTSVKTDKMGNKHFAYTEAGIAGAVYEITAAEDILDPSNDGTVLYKKDTVVDTVTTANDGTGASKLLPLGKYKVTEKTAPNGFVLNEKSQEVELTYKDQNTSIVFDDSSFTNKRQKVELSVQKEDAETSTPLSGALFGLYAKTDIQDAAGNVVVQADELIYQTDSGEDGIAAFDVDLPLSEYYAKELKAPIGYASSDEIVEFDATYQGQDKAVIKLESAFWNDITQVEFSKVDASSNEELEGATQIVYPKDDRGEVFETWVSTKDPHIIKGLEVGKTYVWEETSAPYGFALAEKIEFTVRDTGEVQVAGIMKDELVYGQLKWNKAGEIFMSTDLGQTEFGTVHSPIWEKSNLLGAEITIYAAEDITIGNHTYYKADEKVQTLESDWDSVLSKKLPVGRYYYTESKVPHGYIGDTTKHYFEVKDNQINEIQTITSTLENERPTVDIDMTKVLEEQKIFKNPDAYKDVIFGIYAREDIYNYKGDVAIPYDTLVYTSGIDKDGHLTLADTFDLPNGVYFLKELSTNGQYVLNDKEYDFEISYHGPDVSNYVVHIGKDGTVENKLARGSIRVQKVDTKDAEKKLQGVRFDISANEDMKDVIKTVETDENGVAAFSELELGVYYIRETEQIAGYTLNDHIYKAEVKADGDLLTITCENTPTEMEFSKVGETGSEELEGAKLQVIDKVSGSVVDEWISGKEPHTIHYLVEGKEYVMKEISAPYGYEIAEEITFTAGDGQKVTMKDKMIRSYIKVNKVDYYDHKDILKAAEFTLYSDAACTKKIRSVKTDTKNGIALFDGLLYQTVYVKETKAPAGYQLSDEVVKVTIDDEWVNGDDKLRTIIYADKPLSGGVVTGDTTATGILLSVVTLSGAALIFVSHKRRKTKKSEQ
ncbi:head-tail adaptor protein [[Clostridium] innocuum]|nr:head-tail adaptor protein [[Clostridium] innocuum]